HSQERLKINQTIGDWYSKDLTTKTTKFTKCAMKYRFFERKNRYFIAFRQFFVSLCVLRGLFFTDWAILSSKIFSAEFPIRAETISLLQSLTERRDFDEILERIVRILMNRIMSRLGLILTLVALTSSVAAAQEFQKSYNLGAGGRISVSSISGNVSVTGYDG